MTSSLIGVASPWRSSMIVIFGFLPIFFHVFFKDTALFGILLILFQKDRKKWGNRSKNLLEKSGEITPKTPPYLNIF